MEDYLTFEEFERLSKPETKPPQNVQKTDFIGITDKIFKAAWICAKLIGFGLSRIFKEVYNGLIKLNEGMEKMRQSPMGRQLKAYHNSQPQYDFGMKGLQQDFRGFKQKKSSKQGFWWEG